MLVIRMQRTGRKGHAMFRMVVQDSRVTPTSGKVVAGLGSYDPHTKAVTLNKDKATFYLQHGAQPSTRVARLLKAQGVKLPDWVSIPADKVRVVKTADKRRSTSPPKPVEAEATAEASTDEVTDKEIAAKHVPEETSVEAETSETTTETQEKAEPDTDTDTDAEAKPIAEAAKA